MPSLSKNAAKVMEQIRSTWVIPKKKTASIDVAARVLGKTGKLRAGINVSNHMLISRGADGIHCGVAVDLAKALGQKLGLEVEFVPFASGGLLSDTARLDQWDVGWMGVDAQRTDLISFSSPYAMTPVTYIVKPNSHVKCLLDVDQRGVRVGVPASADYESWIRLNLKYASLVRTESADPEKSWELFSSHDSVDCLAGPRPWLSQKATAFHGSKLLSGAVTMVNQAVGVPRCLTRVRNSADFCEAVSAVNEFITDSKRSGLIEKLLREHKVFGPSGLILAP